MVLDDGPSFGDPSPPPPTAPWSSTTPAFEFPTTRRRTANRTMLLDEPPSFDVQDEEPQDPANRTLLLDNAPNFDDVQDEEEPQDPANRTMVLDSAPSFDFKDDEPDDPASAPCSWTSRRTSTPPTIRRTAPCSWTSPPASTESRCPSGAADATAGNRAWLEGPGVGGSTHDSLGQRITSESTHT
ncbi:MAG: hypothetical protein R3F62_09920 [Planctomycetota bacterium]